MNKPLHDFFSKDHDRVDQLLEQAQKGPNHIDLEIYNQFRVGLLTHIKMEENLLFPTAKEANEGKPLPHFKRFRLEHGALTTLVAVYPNKEVIKVLKHVLQRHDKAEEKPGGMYDICESLTRDQTAELIEKARSITPVPLHPPKKEEYVLQAAKRVLQRAGYNYDEILNE